MLSIDHSSPNLQTNPVNGESIPSILKQTVDHTDRTDSADHDEYYITGGGPILNKKFYPGRSLTFVSNRTPGVRFCYSHAPDLEPIYVTSNQL